ncbi:hypothetical protein RHMOL_Rhmol02G0160300 [Rhododendron molle]|uniref:Uncharacterized protein n=1 Tax=Rhododendron molle TaxID=49168 RepID=A0ACC0PTD5_RHOML|nr:hypothetical protein RHMOL_Rhmol02G0160300 [Rhododendron molle]
MIERSGRGSRCGHGEWCACLELSVLYRNSVDRFYLDCSWEESDEDEQEHFACSIALLSRVRAFEEEKEEYEISCSVHGKALRGDAEVHDCLGFR